MFGHWKLRRLDKTSVTSPLLLRLWNKSRTFKVQAALEAEEMFTFVSVVFVVVMFFSTLVSSVVLWEWLLAGVVVYALVVIGYVYNPIKGLHFQYMSDCEKLSSVYPNPGKATESELHDFAEHFLTDRAGEILRRERAQHGVTFDVDTGIGMLRTLAFDYFQLFSRFDIVKRKDEYGFYFEEAHKVHSLKDEIPTMDPYNSQGNCGLAPRAQPAA